MIQQQPTRIYCKMPIIRSVKFSRNRSTRQICMLVIFASNVKRSDTRNSLPNFCMLVIFAFSLKTGIT